MGVALTLLLLFGPSVKTTPTKTLTYTQFVSDVKAHKVKTASINPTGGVTGTLKGGDDYTSQIPTALTDTQLAPVLKAGGVAVTGVGSSSTLLGVVETFLPLLIFIGIFVWIGRSTRRQLQGGIMGIGGSKAKLYDEDRPVTRFADVAGYEGAKREVAEVVDFLKRPERYTKAGAVGPRGVLMVGPPGSGKTLMARAVAGEAEVPFLALTGSSFVEMFVGVGAKRVRDLFEDARKRAPSIVFIDEIDAIGQRRGGSIVSNDEREQTLNQLLSEMDGFDPSTGVVIMAATNRPEVLDPALLRPGRFDRQVEIPLPNQAERTAILAVHARDKKMGPDVDFDAVSRGTPGFSGADLANLLNESAIVAVRHDRDVITAHDLDEARDRILLGRREASNALLPDEKRSVAVHEAGHALVALLSEHADPVAKITILPAGRALGVTEQLPADEKHLYSESYLLASLDVRLGGRASEILVLGEASTGASNDLAGATGLAIHMVRDWGLSPRLGPVGYSSEGPGYLDAQQQFQSRQYSEGTQQVVDEEVSRLLVEAEQRATALLTGNRRALDSVIALLLERETIDGDELRAVVKASSAPADATAPASAAADGAAPVVADAENPDRPAVPSH
ncbi:MAG TPA: ATP-dependent zinc metalloprotease FtsH [Acidimicrobiales bacterium]|nr:ATP-dependent zinc metalloprotease FtsH [Acidimicrobiales bacterium]